MPTLRRWRIARGLIVFVAVGAVALPVLYWLAILLVPARTPDGHLVMPIGQVAFAIVVAPVAAALAGVFAARPPRAL